jgi:hypothetical protein
MTPATSIHTRDFPRLCARVIFSAVSVVVLAGCSKWRLDREVDRLCAKDGGVKVYETVQVPAEYVPEDSEIFPQFAGRPYGERYGPEYTVKALTTYLVDGNPAMWRDEYKIIRKSDGKTLGISVSYSRVGGDFPSPSAPSSHTCPPQKQMGLARQVFIKQGVKK